MTKSFDDITGNYKDPRSEWEVFVNGRPYNETIELLEFRQSLNSPVEFTVRLKGLPEGIEIPEDSEVVIKKSGLTVLRGVAQEFKPDSFNQYQLKGAGYSAELKGDSKAIVEAENGVSNPFKDSSVTEIVDTLIEGATTGTATARTFSTNYSLDNSLSVDDFRANSEQLEDVNRLMGEYGIEWYLSFDGSNNPVFNVTDQIQNDDGGGGSIGTLKTYGSDQTAERVDQNVNRNKGSFDGVKVRGYGDGDDQITASAGSIGKDSRVLIYTDKTILSPSQAQKRADAINEYKTVAWQEIEVKPNNPNALYSIGDLLTVDSEKAYLSDDYRVVESYYKIWPGENQFESKLNLSNKPQTFLSEFQGEKAKRESQTDYMQGSRNVWGEKETTNATNAEPITIDFYIPPDVKDKVGKNRTQSISLNYSCSAFRKNSTNSETRVSSTNLTKSNKMDSTTTGSSNKMDSTSTEDDNGLEESITNEVQMETVEQEQAGTTSAGGSTVVASTSSSTSSETPTQGSWYSFDDAQVDAGTDNSMGAEFHFTLDMAKNGSPGSFFNEGELRFDLRVTDELGNKYPSSSGIRYKTVHGAMDTTGDGSSDEFIDQAVNDIISIPEDTKFREYTLEIKIENDGAFVDVDTHLTVFDEHSHDVSPNHKDSGGSALLSPGNDGNLSFNTDPFIYDITDNTSGTVDSVTDNTSSTTDDVTDNTDSTVVSVNDDLLAGTTANEIVSIVIDGEQVVDDIYGQSSSDGTNQDSEIDITSYLNTDSDGKPSVGWHTVEITPDGATFLKSRVFLDHKKDN